MTQERRIAVVDLGTNSTRLLIAELSEAGAVETLVRRSEVTRLGDGVDASGRLSDAAIERVYDVLATYRELADEHGVADSIAVATSAVRDAENGPELQDAVRERFGFDIRIISGGEEARLTFLGATSGRDDSAPTLVVDIGGGSTEYVIGTPDSQPDFHVSTHLGSVRQSERHLASDPPGHHETDALRVAAREIIAEGVPAKRRREVRAGIAVAGTATQLASVAQALEPYEPARVEGYDLMLDDCERMLAMLASLSLAERKQVAGMHPDRAATIVAGAAILIESMRAFGLEHVEVSEADILHGAALEALAQGGGG